MAVRKALAFVLVITACGGSATAPTDVVAQTATTGTTARPVTAAAPTDDAATPTATSPAEPATRTMSARQRPEGPDAPAFTLALGEGGEFSPADEARPIYVVFWAEW